MPPSAAAALASPTFHLPDLTNWKTPQRYPRAHERISIPKADELLPLPWPVTTMTSGLSRGLRRRGSALPRSSLIATTGSGLALPHLFAVHPITKPDLS